MPDLGKYGTEVLSAYGVTIFLLLGLVWFTWARSVKVRKLLADAEEKIRNG